MSATVYEALQVNADDSTQPLGTIAIEAGRLSIVSLVDESRRARVQKSLDDLNNRPFLVQKAPPANDERYGIGAIELNRGEPGFDDMLIAKLASGHGIRLVPTGS